MLDEREQRVDGDDMLDDDPLVQADTLAYHREGWFDHSRHWYYIEGKPVPSVTQAIEVLRSGADWFQRGGGKLYMPMRFEAIHPDVMEAASERGRDVHRACADLAAGMPNYVPTDNPAYPYFEAFKKFLDESRFKIHLSEHRVFSKTYGFGGTLDLTGWLDGAGIAQQPVSEDSYCTIDIKTGMIDEWTGVQLAGYCFPQDHPMPTTIRRFALKLTKKGSYKLVPLTDRNDFPLFLTAVNAYRGIQNKSRR